MTQAAGQEAQASLYTRASGEGVSAALVIRIQPDWYIYHTELGNEEGYGQALTVQLASEGIEWDELIFPEHLTKHVDDEFLGKYSYNYHIGKVTAYAKGTRVAGATPGPVKATLAGQVCSDITGLCILYDEEVESKGASTSFYVFLALLGGAIGYVLRS